MSLEIELQQEQVAHLDVAKFVEVQLGTSVRDTVKQMREEGFNCAVITDNGALKGIFTDRDLLRKVADTPENWDKPIDEIMTKSPITVKWDAPAYTALALMDEKQFRNVPVVDTNGYVVGNLTHYAIIKYLSDRFPESVYNLPPRPDRVTRKRDGA